MQHGQRTSNLACGLALALAVLLALSASWRATSLYGLGVDGDAVWTLSAGSSLAHGGGLVTCLGEVFSLWPPLYPLSMAALELLGLDVLGALRILHLAALAATMLLSARLAFVLSGSQVAAIATAGTLALSTRTHEYTVQVVSESFFLPLVLGALLAASALARGFSRPRFAWLVGLSALACLQRYLGVALVGAIALCVVARPEWGTTKERLRRAATYVALSIAPLAAWLVRNRLVEERWTGGRDEAPAELGQAAASVLETLRHWAAPEHLPGWSGWLALVIGGVLAILLVRTRPELRAPALVVVAFCASYAALLVSMAATVVIDPIGDRLMLPLLPPLVALAWSAALSIRRVPLGLAGIAVAALWLDALPRLGERIAFWEREGAGGFHTRLWQEHPVTRALPTLELAQPCWSNGAELLWLARGEPARFLRGGAKAWDRAGSESAPRGGTVIWFQDQGRPPAFLKELERHVRVEPLASVPDGLLLRLSPR